MRRQQGCSKQRTHSCLFIAAALTLFMLTMPAAAQETQPGDACSSAGQFRRAGGPEIGAGGHFMTCDGSNWLSLLDYEDTGQIHFQVGNDTSSCTSAKQGRLRYGSGSDLWEYCDGTDWLGLGNGIGGVSGLWNAGSDDAIYYNSGTPKVGIGTTPSSALDVLGEITSRSPANAGFYVRLIGSTTGYGLSQISAQYYLDLNINNAGSGLGKFTISDNGTNQVTIKSGKVGIGDTSPTTAKLVVKGASASGSGSVSNISAFSGGGINIAGSINAASQDALTYQAGGGAAIAFGRNNWDTFMDFYTNSSGNNVTGGLSNHVMRLTGDGYVGIGTTSPNVELDVIGDIEYTGTIQDVSDGRLKESIEPLASEIEQITQLRPVSFVMKDGDGGRELGFIAQDVESIYPALVSTADDEMSTKSLNYVGLIAPLTRAVQEMAADKAVMEEEFTKRIDKLATDKAALEERLNELEARLDAIE